MGIGRASLRATVVTMRLAGAAFGSALAMAPIATSPSAAQATLENEQMLLEADTLTYDQDTGIVVASGDVRIAYQGRRLVAQRVEFNRNTSRMYAFGDVEMVDADGNRHYADELDVTDDLGEGFANAIRVETTDETYFAAESGERQDGSVTTFNSGVYTACKPCEEHPEKPPIWRVKATKIVWNGEEKTIRFINSRLELFGLPIAYFPVLEVPDHTVKRKTGLLSPSLRFGTYTGTGLVVPYYWALSPTYDLTTTVTGYTKQGFLTEAEWRQRFNNGAYSVKAAGIYQLQLSAFPGRTVDATTTLRGMIGSKGEFRINPRWTFGWDVKVQSDKNFAHTYNIDGYNQYYRDDQIYLTGLNDRNYFDLRAHRFSVQESILGLGGTEVQPWVLPSFDYTRKADEPVAGGELTLNVNAQNLYRSNLQTTPTALVAGTNIPGVQGANGRLTTEVEWRRTFVSPGGLLVTPLLAVRGDAIYSNLSATTVAAMAPITVGGVPITDIRSAYFRYMATAGMEVSWPVLFASDRSSHVLEPVAQVFARPNAPYATTLGIPNEDAQSFVFDATNLFERDKFSGYDVIEGGVRANVGLRYSGSFDNGWTAQAIGGQSYHLAGINPYNPFGAASPVVPNLVNAGAFSGLETSRSDYVALVGLTSPRGLSVAAGGRFDETTLEVRRVDLRASASAGSVSIGGNYAYIQAQPLYGFATDRHQLTVNASARFLENWRIFGSGTYDFVSGALLQDSIGFGYADECFAFTLQALQMRSAGGPTTTSVGFNFSLRTIGDFGQSTSGLGLGL